MPMLARKVRIRSPCSCGDRVAERPVVGDDLDLLGRPGTAGRALGDADQLVGQRDQAAVGGVDRAGAVAVLVEGLDPHAVRLEALDQGVLAVGEDAVEAELGAGRADDLAGGLGEPHLLGQRLALQRGDHGAAGLLGVRLEHAALRLVGALAVDGQVDGERPAQHAVSSVSGAKSRSSGCQASGSSIGVTSGTQPQVSPALGSRRSCGTNRSRPQWSAFSISAIRVSMGRTAALELDPGLVAARDGRDLELAVLAGHADRGHAEPREVGHAFGNQLEGVTRGPVGPDRSDGRQLVCGFPRHQWLAPPLGRDTCYVGHAVWGRVRQHRDGESAEPTPARRLGPVHQPPRTRTRGDGRLTAALDPQDQGPQDACGVFGVWAPGEDVAKLTYFGLYALQHRGQESAGIAVSNGRQILVYKDMGLVSQVFDETTLASLNGHLAIGHCRYSTTGASTWQNAQPTFRPTADGSIALGHNGNLINTAELTEAGRRPARPARPAGPAHPQRRRSPPTTPGWSPPCSPTTPTPAWSSGRSRCCRSCVARSASSG